MIAVVSVLMTGLPGTGKSTVADAVARSLGAGVVSADPIDAALLTAGVPNEDGKVGYEVMKALAANELDAGRGVRQRRRTSSAGAEPTFASADLIRVLTSRAAMIRPAPHPGARP